MGPRITTDPSNQHCCRKLRHQAQACPPLGSIASGLLATRAASNRFESRTNLRPSLPVKGVPSCRAQLHHRHHSRNPGVGSVLRSAFAFDHRKIRPISWSQPARALFLLDDRHFQFVTSFSALAVVPALGYPLASNLSQTLHRLFSKLVFQLAVFHAACAGCRNQSLNPVHQGRPKCPLHSAIAEFGISPGHLLLCDS